MTVMRHLSAALAACALLMTAACDVPQPPATTASPVFLAPGARMSADEAMATFNRVVAAVEPVAESECRRRTPGRRCDFQIVVASDSALPSNAYQSIDGAGRPVITFTQALIRDAGNADELAFVMSHEAAHHIRDHLTRQRRNAETAAVVFGGLASLNGLGTTEVETAQKLGAVVGARTYSKDFELEADELGTIIAWRAGFDPLVGAGFFSRIPDPGNRFLGTHPPNGDRIATVRRTSATLGLN